MGNRQDVRHAVEDIASFAALRSAPPHGVERAIQEGRRAILCSTSLYSLYLEVNWGERVVARGNIVETTKLQLTIAASTDRLIEEIAAMGLHGTSKSEVACSIIRMWIWENEAKLRASGIEIRKAKSSSKATG